MRFKVDENLPAEIAWQLIAVGHEAETVVDEGMAGIADSSLLDAMRRGDRILLTLDKGIANIHRYPPGSHAGVVLFRPPSVGRGAVLRFVSERPGEVLQRELKGRLLLVTSAGIRLR